MLLSQLCFPNPSTLFSFNKRWTLAELECCYRVKFLHIKGNYMTGERAERGRFTFRLYISLIYGWWLQLQVKTIWCHQRERAVTRPSSSLECLGKIPCALQRRGSTTPNFSSVAAVGLWWSGKGPGADPESNSHALIGVSKGHLLRVTVCIDSPGNFLIAFQRDLALSWAQHEATLVRVLPSHLRVF